MAWLILHCRPNFEHKSAEQLSRDCSAVCFIPLVRRWSRPHGKRRPKLVERCAFACYFFVQEPRPVHIEHGRLLAVNGAYCTLPDQEIEAMRATRYLRRGRAKPVQS